MPKDKLEDYLSFFHRGKYSTRYTNARNLRKFCRWIKKTPQQLVDEYEKAKTNNDLDAWKRDAENEALAFYNWIREQKNPRTGKVYAINYCNTTGSSILAFHHQNTMVLEGVMDSFAPTQMPTDEYRFTQDDLRKCFYFGDTEEKCLISLAVSYAQGSKQFLGLEAKNLRYMVDEAKNKGLDFAKWVGTREKTGVPMVSFLTPEAIESVDAYLQLLEKKHGKLPRYIWCNSKPNRHISNEGLNKKLRRLVSKANIKTGNKRVIFHTIRKFTFSRLRRIDKDMAKIVCGKSVSISDMTYEELEEQAEKVFRLAYKNISLNGDVSGQVKRKQAEEIKALKEVITQLESENRTLKNRIDLLQQRLEENTDALRKMHSDFSERLTWLENKLKKREKVSLT